MKRSAAEYRAIEIANETPPKIPLIRCVCGRAIDVPRGNDNKKQTRQTPTWLTLIFGLMLGVTLKECAPDGQLQRTQSIKSHSSIGDK